MAINPLLQLNSFGQSIWLDFLSREILASGKLQRLIEEDGLRGVTSNPAIFQEAISGGHDYDDAIRVLVHDGKHVDEIYQAITIEDIQWAADLFRSLYNHSNGEHGYVSLEVSPHLANDTEGTIEEARRLWRALKRPNVFIKVPATKAGLPAIKQLISEGINVNVTLLFGLPRYQEVARAYIEGLAERMKAGLPLGHIASVASFFLSRIDVLVDEKLEELENKGIAQSELATQLRGQVAIASAKIAYQMYKDIFKSAEFGRLEQQGAKKQRVLWASTSTKNPEYSDVKYVEALIGPETINTMTLKTLEAYRDHGNPIPRLEEDIDKAYQVLDNLAEAGISIGNVTQQLEEEAVQKFIKPYDELMTLLAQEYERYRVAEVIGRPG
jgi:transaldolase